MTAMKPLLDVALVGTGRQAPVAPALQGPAGLLLQQIAAGEAPAAHRLLAMAGALSLCEQAGYRPAPAPAAATAAPADTVPAAGEALARSVLAPLFADGPDRLQHEAFTALAQAGLRLPPALLPAALEAGRRSLALRPSLARVLGRRGLWLASLNPAWKFAAGADTEAPWQEQWEHGSVEQRRAALAAWRAEDAATARERLAAELPQLSARERADFVALLVPGLSSEDEAFLDGLLKDRSKEVRQAAAQLLLRLPASRHARAMATALAPLVRKESGLLGAKLLVEAPAAADSAWKDEGIDATRPNSESLGERAWWLFQLVRNVPLAWWSDHAGMAPADLIKASGKSEWKEALRRGWRDATLASGDAAWAQALLQDWDEKSLGHDRASVLALLPLREREQHWLRPLDGAHLYGVLAEILQACPPGHVLSADTSQKLARAMASQLDGGDTLSLRHLVADVLCLLEPSTLEPLANAVRKLGDTPSANEFKLRAERIVAARRALAQLAQPSPT